MRTLEMLSACRLLRPPLWQGHRYSAGDFCRTSSYTVRAGCIIIQSTTEGHLAVNSKAAKHAMPTTITTFRNANMSFGSQ